jgi:DNA repair protein RadC
LVQATVEELGKVRGIGLEKACQIKAAFELAARLEGYPEKGLNPAIKNPVDVVAMVRNRLKDKKQEYFLNVLLDTGAQIIKICEISVGSLDTSIVHPREVFKEAISASAASFIFVHNHPSGDTTPPTDDIGLTKRLMKAGQIIGIEVLDHIIIGDPGWASMKALGVM